MLQSVTTLITVYLQHCEAGWDGGSRERGEEKGGGRNDDLYSLQVFTSLYLLIPPTDISPQHSSSCLAFFFTLSSWLVFSSLSLASLLPIFQLIQSSLNQLVCILTECTGLDSTYSLISLSCSRQSAIQPLCAGFHHSADASRRNLQLCVTMLPPIGRYHNHSFYKFLLYS